MTNITTKRGTAEMSKVKDIASIVDSDRLPELKQMDEYLEVVNLTPPDDWLQKHPMAANTKYLPIGRIETMLTKLFQEWKVEVLREGQMLNSVYCVVRLHYKHPISGWTYQDGIAAVPVKTKKGEDPSNLSAILNDAIQTGLPAAESFAIKDAAEKIGKIFGKDINRKETFDFTPSYNKEKDRTSASIQNSIAKARNENSKD